MGDCLHYTHDMRDMNREPFRVSVGPEGTSCQMQRVRDSGAPTGGHVRDDPRGALGTITRAFLTGGVLECTG